MVYRWIRTLDTIRPIGNVKKSLGEGSGEKCVNDEVWVVMVLEETG